MSNQPQTADAPACAPPAAPPAPEPPAYMIDAAELAMAEHLVRWNMNLAPAALRTLATDAIKAARGAALAQRMGSAH